jgi:hypothetical protein
MRDVAELLPLAAVGGVWACAVALARPRLLLYAIFALLPTQFLFVPVATFFVSPADVLVCASALGLLARLAVAAPEAWRAVYQHRWLLAMIGAYLVGFVVLDVFSRTVVRLPAAVLLSLLAAELLRTRRHVGRAAAAVVIAGTLDAAYGLYFIARGTPLHPTRFEGMSDVNYAAMLITTAAAIALAQLVRTPGAGMLARPASLGGIAAATLSQMGAVAFVGAWLAILRRVVSRANKQRILIAGVVVAVVALAAPPIRGRLLARIAPQVETDGVARTSAEVRWMVHALGWRAFLDSPAVGLGYFQFQAYSNTNPQIQQSTYGVGYPTHDSYLEVLAEGGLLAFVCFLLHWAQFLARWPAAVRVAAAERDPALAAALVGLPIMLVCAAFANVLMVYSFWAVCGLALAAMNVVRREGLVGAAPSGAIAIAS